MVQGGKKEILPSFTHCSPIQLPPLATMSQDDVSTVGADAGDNNGDVGMLRDVDEAVDEDEAVGDGAICEPRPKKARISTTNRGATDEPWVSAATRAATEYKGLFDQMAAQERQGVVVGWRHHHGDLPRRRNMIRLIEVLLREHYMKRPVQRPGRLRNLPDLARRLEDSLYRTASSPEAYDNLNTLKQRLQNVAVRMAARRKRKHVC